MKITSTTQTAVLIIGFNRPNLLQKLLTEIDFGSRRVYLSIDAPRNIHEFIQVEECKRIAKKFKSMRLKGTTALNFREKNFGLSSAVEDALNWAFQKEEKLVILEDDVFPSNAFFDYMDRFLNEFQDDLQIWQVGGHNPNPRTTLLRTEYLSIFPMIWGWGTWKNRWELFDRDASQYEGNLGAYLRSYTDSGISDSLFSDYFESRIGKLQAGFDTWDYQWAFAMWKARAFSIQPGVNLTLNLGQNSSGTNTNSSEVFITKWKLEPGRVMRKIVSPEIDIWQDMVTFAYVFGRTRTLPLKWRVFLKLQKKYTRFRTTVWKIGVR